MAYKKYSAMKHIFRNLAVLMSVLLLFNTSYAEKFIGAPKNVQKHKSIAAGCPPASNFQYLDINNVRARINTGGDMWWDFDISRYYVPKEGTATSMFSGSLWIGGLDINNQLKLAAVRYRQVGNDYWPGPLTVDGTAAVDEATCAKYDQFFVMERAWVDEYLAWWHSDNPAEEYPDYTIPDEILDWPAHGDEAKNQSFYLAPFYDNDGDGVYDPFSGDYPYYDIDNSLCPLNRQLNPEDPPARTMEEDLTEYPIRLVGSILSDQVIKGDQTLWWVFNDKGNFHTETQGASIGLEIRAQAFAFTTNDEINNMTFYSYEIINRSTFELTRTFFSPWVDTDLGYAWDDYVGCDVERGLGYCYNGAAIDGSGDVEAYGEQPPAIGVDFFQGPYIDPDGRDNPKYTPGDCSIIYSEHEWDQMAINGVNFGNNIVDDERFGMRRFVYHNNSGGLQGDPQIAPEYYNYLRGYWKDNSRMLYGGNAHFSSGAVGPECNFMFPGNTDPCNWGTIPPGTPPNGGYNQNGLYWTEEEAGTDPGDRRFMQSAGPFTLRSGAVNYITVGIPWARAGSGGPWASVELLRTVDDKCQNLFESCFDVIDGPDAPDMTFQELDRELILYLDNSITSNNYNETYTEYDNSIPQPSYLDPTERNDSLYTFEGYQIYQLANAQVTAESIGDPDLARLVAQFDVENEVSTIINYSKNEEFGFLEPEVMVEGANNGIRHTLRITEDAFASGDNRLVNHKQYYYLAIAYAHNEYMPYRVDPAAPVYLNGQKKAYLAGRRNIQVQTAIPHKTVNGIAINSDYGDQPQITRLDGKGNGGLPIEMTAESEAELLSKLPAGSIKADGDTVDFGDPEYPIVYEPVYKPGNGPVDVKVVDPLNVKEANYILKFEDVTTPSSDSMIINDASWTIIDQETGMVYNSEKSISTRYEQLLLDIGLSVNVEQIVYANDTTSIKEGYNGLVVSTVKYADSSRQWLDGVRDNQVPGSPQNWIRSGTYDGSPAALNDWNLPSFAWDPFEYYEKIANGTWAPYFMVAGSNQNVGNESIGPAYGAFNLLSKASSGLNKIHSLDIVMTPDKSKWTRCVVMEMGSEPSLTEPQQDGTPTERFMARGGLSVDKEGNPATPGSGPSMNPEDPNYISETGMGWFPGYAVDQETGERLNIAFGEDSWLVGQNGRDMIFNPTAKDLSLNNPFADPNLYNPLNGQIRFGGKHFVYVFRHGSSSNQGLGIRMTSPAYDAGKWFKATIDSLWSPDAPPFYPSIRPMMYGMIMYVGLPMAVKDKEWLSNEARVQIRVKYPYERFIAQVPDTNSTYVPNNNYNPMYQFSTAGIATDFYDAEVAQNDLDIINVVPNPYYAYSAYEENALDNLVKITNLPEQCRVTIYNVKGTLIRQFTKDSPVTSIEWDLKNFAGVPIAGGIYLIHVKSDDGERIIKWFGSLRPVDLNVF